MESETGDQPLPTVTPLGANWLVVERDGYEPEGWEIDAALDHEARVIEEGIADEQVSRARAYLSLHGDAAWERIERCLRDADSLADSHPALALVAAITAAELTVRFLLLRPMLAGLVFSDRVADLLGELAFSGRTDTARRLLPDMCRPWNLDVEELRTVEGTPVWASLLALWKTRNAVVHQGAPASAADARAASENTRALIVGLVAPFADHLELRGPAEAWSADGVRQNPFDRPTARR